ncbi:MAG TPA: hypothetical protein VLU46_09245, partial [Thermoanaerobaculia bacterium]|nr:hypothetical protein [Thermoanaerobaculia bacterium]
RTMGKWLDQANAPLQFGAAEGPRFFEKDGWRLVDVQSMLHTAGKLKRLPLMMRLWTMFPAPKDGAAGPKQPWSGVAVMENATENGATAAHRP